MPVPWVYTDRTRRPMTHLISPQQLIVRDIFDSIVRVYKLLYTVSSNVLAVVAGALPAVWFAHCQQAHTPRCLHSYVCV